MTYERLLLPTDGSVVTEPATRRAIDLAAEMGAGLVVCSVVEAYALPVGEHREGLRETLATEAEEFVDRVTHRADDAGITEVEGTVASGKPAEAILEVAADHGCDLIVMGPMAGPNTSRTSSGASRRECSRRPTPRCWSSRPTKAVGRQPESTSPFDWHWPKAR